MTDLPSKAHALWCETVGCGCVKPDYEAALEELRRARPEWTPYVGDPFVIRNIVDAAVGGRLLVDPPKEEE